MNPAAGGLHLRAFQSEDPPLLRAVFESAVHTVASRHYTPEQCAAWAPHDHDAAAWAERMVLLQPIVAEIGGEVVGFTSLQPTGYIDMFFVAGPHVGRGVATSMMARLYATAQALKLDALFANVSLTAESFFLKHGFAIEARQAVERAGVMLRNARMRKVIRIAPSPTSRRDD